MRTNRLRGAARFSRRLPIPDPLKVGARLISVNTYAPLAHGVAPDLTPGEANMGNWGNFAPYIADLLCDQPWRIDQRVRQIAEEEWRRCEALAATAPRRLRDGRPTRCMKAAR